MMDKYVDKQAEEIIEASLDVLDALHHPRSPLKGGAHQTQPSRVGLTVYSLRCVPHHSALPPLTAAYWCALGWLCQI